MRMNEVEGVQAEILILDWSYWEIGKQVACRRVDLRDDCCCYFACFCLVSWLVVGEVICKLLFYIFLLS